MPPAGSMPAGWRTTSNGWRALRHCVAQHKTSAPSRAAQRPASKQRGLHRNRPLIEPAAELAKAVSGAKSPQQPPFRSRVGRVPIRVSNPISPDEEIQHSPHRGQGSLNRGVGLIGLQIRCTGKSDCIRHTGLRAVEPTKPLPLPRRAPPGLRAVRSIAASFCSVKARCQLPHQLRPHREIGNGFAGGKGLKEDRQITAN